MTNVWNSLPNFRGEAQLSTWVYRIPFRRPGWLGIALVAAGMNLMFLGPSAMEALPSRIASHAAMTLLLFALFAFGLKLRARRYAMDYKPLVERLAAMKAALEEHTR